LGYSYRVTGAGAGVIDLGTPIFGVIFFPALLNKEDSRFLLPPKILVVSLSSGREILPSLGVGGILLDPDIVVDGIVKK